jgi:hypothetical protein
MLSFVPARFAWRAGERTVCGAGPQTRTDRVWGPDHPTGSEPPLWLRRRHSGSGKRKAIPHDSTIPLSPSPAWPGGGIPSYSTILSFPATTILTRYPGSLWQPMDTLTRVHPPRIPIPGGRDTPVRAYSIPPRAQDSV